MKAKPQSRRAYSAPLDQAVRADIALALLKSARDCAQAQHLDGWQLAVEISEFRRFGIPHTTLRFLVLAGRARHAYEVTKPRSKFREFQRAHNLALTDQSCFVSADSPLVETPKQKRQILPSPNPGDSHELKPGRAEMPRWDSLSRTLYVGDAVVKRFKVPALSQERILSAFQDEGWPPYIYDPLPNGNDGVAKRRLHNAINALNRHQRTALIRFTGNGDGQGIGWVLLRRP